MSLKRLNREIMKVFPDKMRETSLPYELSYQHVHSRFDSEKHSKTIAELLIENPHIKLGHIDILYFTIPSDYPFKPPTVWVPHKIANKKYDKWCVDLTNEIIKTSNKPVCNPFIAWAFSIIETPMYACSWTQIPFQFPLNCLCCTSLTCHNNWGPSHTISQILIEYLSRKKFALYCSSLGQKRILSIFNNERWKLSDDIIFCIIQHLNIPDHLKIY